MRKLILSVAVAAGTLVASPAVADQPTVIHPFDIAATYSIPAGVACDFPVEVEVSGKSAAILFDDGARTISLVPGLRATFTNTVTGEWVTLNIAGPGTWSYTDNGDGTVTQVLIGTGNWDHLHPDGELIYTQGRFIHVWVGDETTLLSFEHETLAGREVDLCQVLS